MLKIILAISIQIMTSVSFAQLPSQNETIKSQPKNIETQLNLIEHLFLGLDFKLNDVVINSKNPDVENTYYYVSLLLAITAPDGNKTKIELFRSDNFLIYEGYARIDRESYIKGESIFKAIDPYVMQIQHASKLHLVVSVHRIVIQPALGNELGETINSDKTVFNINLYPNVVLNGFEQDIERKMAINPTETHHMSDLGFGLFFR